MAEAFRIHTFIAVSALHVEAKLKRTFDDVVEMCIRDSTNIVLSRTPYEHEGVIWKENFESAVDFVKEFDEIMLI